MKENVRNICKRKSKSADEKIYQDIKTTKLIIRSFLHYRGRLPRRFRIPARVLTMTPVVPEVVEHLDPSASKRQPAWTHRTQVSPIIAKKKYNEIIISFALHAFIIYILMMSNMQLSVSE